MSKRNLGIQILYNFEWFDTLVFKVPDFGELAIATYPGVKK